MRVTRLALFGLFSAALSFAATVSAEKQEKVLKTTRDLEKSQIPDWLNLIQSNEGADVSHSEAPQCFSTREDQLLLSLASGNLFEEILEEKHKHHLEETQKNPENTRAFNWVEFQLLASGNLFEGILEEMHKHHLEEAQKNPETTRAFNWVEFQLRDLDVAPNEVQPEPHNTQIPEWVKLHPTNKDADVSKSKSPQFFSTSEDQLFLYSASDNLLENIQKEKARNLNETQQKPGIR